MPPCRRCGKAPVETEYGSERKVPVLWSAIIRGYSFSTGCLARRRAHNRGQRADSREQGKALLVANNTKSTEQPKGAGNGPRLVRILSPEARFGIVLVVARFSARVALGQQIVFLTSTMREISTVTELVRHQASLARVSERSIWRWYRRFLQEGYRGLIDRSRGDKDVSRAFSKRDDAAAFVLTSFVDGHTVSWIHRQLTQLWPRLYGTASVCPCFDTVRLLVRTMVPPEVAKKHR